MLWFVLILIVLVVVFGVAIYRIDQSVRSKHEQKFNPHEWQLPGHIELPRAMESALQETPPKLQALSQPLAAANSTVKLVYHPKPTVYSGAHYAFYQALQAALAGDFYVLTNIPAADVLALVSHPNALATQVARNNLAAQKFAFVVCTKTHLKPLCVLDLGAAMDNSLRAICASAHFPCISINTQADYDSQWLRAKMLTAIGLPNASINLDAGAGDASALDIAVVDVAEVRPAQQMKDNAIDLMLCPSCAAVMLKRKAKNGENAGQLFWLCSTYPACRGMRAIT